MTMNPLDKAIADALARDGLAEAEKLTGQRWSTDPINATSCIGMALQMDANKQRNAILSLADDTTFSCDLAKYLRIVADEGFELALELPFAGRFESAVSEKFYVFWHPKDGILLAFDTYNGEHVNGGSFYYNIKFPDDVWPIGSVTSSGGFRKDDDGAFTFVGSHDCREALRFNIRRLREHGRFVTPWLHSARPWLNHYGDTGDHVHRQTLNDDRVRMLPVHVQKAIAAAP